MPPLGRTGAPAAKVRTSTQVSRNNTEIGLLSAYWNKKDFEIKSVTFELEEKVSMSWHLSKDEKQDIADG